MDGVLPGRVPGGVLPGWMPVSDVDMIPRRALSSRLCQGWRCNETAIWNRWSGFYCYSCAIRAGWLPGAVRRPGDQLELAS